MAPPVLRCVLLVSTCLAGVPALAAAPPATAPAREGRLLFSTDDDWDFATPAGAASPSRLAHFGPMPWSALDWVEEGLPAVRAILYGTHPGALTPRELADLRGNAQRTYAHVEHRPGRLAGLLGGGDAPNVVILHRDNAADFTATFADRDLTALAGFVRQGGRLLVLDDSGCYHPVLERLVLSDARMSDEAAKLRRQVFALVARLGADEFAERERAHEALVALGHRILPLIDPLTDTDPEVANRLHAIRTTLQHRPRPAEAAQTIPDDELAALAKKLPAGLARAELRDTTCNATREVGKALLLRFPAVGPATRQR